MMQFGTLTTISQSRRRTAVPVSGGGGLPSWITNNANSVGTWYEMPSTSLFSIEPGTNAGGSFAGKTDGWTSFVADPVTSEVFAAAVGGHTDYAGNEVGSINLSNASPAWSQLRGPTLSVSTNVERYADGRASSRHTYYSKVLDNHGGNRRILLVAGTSPWGPGGYITSGTEVFDLSTNDWVTPLATLTGALVGWENPMVCRDPRNGNIFMSGAPSAWVMAKWTKASNTWSDVNVSCPMACYKACSAWDTARNKIFILGGQYAAQHTYEPDTDTFATITLSGAAAGSVQSEYAGMIYSSVLDVFLVRTAVGGGTVYQITPSGVCTVFSTTGGSAIPAPVATQINNRFLYIPLLKGVVVWPTYTGNGWYLRVEA